MVTRRESVPEWMDEPDLERNLHEDALSGIERINRVSGAAGALWRRIRRIPGSLRVLDLACGSGDVACALQQRAREAGRDVSVFGCDVSAVAVDVARERGGAEFFRHDVVADGVPAGYDVYLCSLFLHHLSDEDSISVLRGMSQGRALFVSDLRRTRRGLLLARVVTPFLTRSPVVRKDSELSVRGAHTMQEARELLRRAGLEDARIERQWPQRFLVSWIRSS